MDPFEEYMAEKNAADKKEPSKVPFSVILFISGLVQHWHPTLTLSIVDV